MFSVKNTPGHAYITVAEDVAKDYNIKRNQWAKLVWQGEQLLGAEISMNGSTTYLARAVNEFTLAGQW